MHFSWSIPASTRSPSHGPSTFSRVCRTWICCAIDQPYWWPTKLIWPDHALSPHRVSSSIAWLEAIMYLTHCCSTSWLDGKCLACTFGAKFIEVSVGINHNCDELLAGTLTQIRLKKDQNLLQVRKRERERERGIKSEIEEELICVLVLMVLSSSSS